MNPQLKELYKATLLRHSKQPQNTGPLADATASHTLRNPLCGDEITVHVKIDNDTVSSIQYETQSCAICTAAASMMSERLPATTTTEAAQFAQDFIKHFQSKTLPSDLTGDLAALAGVLEFPSRIRCATLPFEALRGALRGN